MVLTPFLKSVLMRTTFHGDSHSHWSGSSSLPRFGNQQTHPVTSATLHYISSAHTTSHCLLGSQLLESSSSFRVGLALLWPAYTRQMTLLTCTLDHCFSCPYTIETVLLPNSNLQCSILMKQGANLGPQEYTRF